MSKHKHTPGPWWSERILTEDGQKLYCIKHDESGFVVYNMPPPMSCAPEFEANARLIAAAPAMLEALEQLVRWIREPWGEDDGQANDYVISEAYRAISLATGKEPHA